MMKQRKHLALLIVALCLVHSTVEFSFDGTCKAYLDDGRVIDLSPLDNPSDPL